MKSVGSVFRDLTTHASNINHPRTTQQCLATHKCLPTQCSTFKVTIHTTHANHTYTNFMYIYILCQPFSSSNHFPHSLTPLAHTTPNTCTTTQQQQQQELAAQNGGWADPTNPGVDDNVTPGYTPPPTPGAYLRTCVLRGGLI